MLGVSFPLILFLLMKIPYVPGHRSDLTLLSIAPLEEKKNLLQGHPERSFTALRRTLRWNAAYMGGRRKEEQHQQTTTAK